MTHKPPRILRFVKIPGEIASCSDLSANAKILLGIVTYMCRKTGETKAGNRFFAINMGLDERTVRNIMFQLKKAGYLQTKLFRNAKGKVWKRAFGFSFPTPSVL